MADFAIPVSQLPLLGAAKANSTGRTAWRVSDDRMYGKDSSHAGALKLMFNRTSLVLVILNIAGSIKSFTE